MNLLRCYLVANECYQVSGDMNPSGIVVHSTGANNPWLKRDVQALKNQQVGLSLPWDEVNEILGKNIYNNHWNTWFVDGYRECCVNAFIGKLADGSIATVQTLPWTKKPWGCGAGANGSFNNTHIQFEVMEDNLDDADYFEKVINESVELCAYLCRQYGIEVKNIVSHHESYIMGYGSNHGDIDHWLKRFGLTMDDYREKVRIKLQEDEPMTKEEREEFDALKAKCEKLEKKVEEVEIKYNWTTACPEYAIPTIQKLLDKGILRGDEKGLGLTPQMLRTLVILDRAGVFD